MKITCMRVSYLEMGIRWWSRVPWCWCRNHLSGSESEAAAAGRRRRRPTPPPSPPRMAAPLKSDRPSRHWPRPSTGGAPPTMTNNGSDSARAHDVRGRVCKSTSLLSSRRFFFSTFDRFGTGLQRAGVSMRAARRWIIFRAYMNALFMCVYDVCFSLLSSAKAKRATAINVFACVGRSLRINSAQILLA